MNTELKEILRLLKENGAVLARENGHRVWRLRDGRMFTMSSTPSDVRALKNALSVLRRLLGVNDLDRGAPGQRREKRYNAAAPERECGYSFLAGGTLPSMKDQLKEIKHMVRGNGSGSGNSGETSVPMGECFACGKPWSMPVGEHTWHEGRMKADPRWRMPTRCKECRDKREPVTVEVKPGVTVTTQVPAYRLPGREPNMRQSLEASTQTEPDNGTTRVRRHAALKRSALKELRSIPYRITQAKLAEILGVSTAWIMARKKDGTLLSPVGHEGFDGRQVAQLLEEKWLHWHLDVPGEETECLKADPTPIVASTKVSESVVATENLSNDDLLVLAYIALESEKPNPSVLVKLAAELRPRLGTVQPSRAVLKWMMSA